MSPVGGRCATRHGRRERPFSFTVNLLRATRRCQTGRKFPRARLKRFASGVTFSRLGLAKGLARDGCPAWDPCLRGFSFLNFASRREGHFSPPTAVVKPSPTAKRDLAAASARAARKELRRRGF